MKMLRRGPPEINVTGADGEIIGALTIDSVNAALLQPGR
jgi:hypothetical protein